MRGIAEIVCVRNQYNIAHRGNDGFIDMLAAEGAASVQVGLAWLLRRAPNIPLIPGTSSAVRLRKNPAAASLTLSDDAVAELDAIGQSRTQ